jgi:hypothetical protein
MSKDDSWRLEWRVSISRDDDDADLGLPHALHSSGLAYGFTYDTVDDDGRSGWILFLHPSSYGREAELRSELGEAAYRALLSKLSDEVTTLWRERGFKDGSPESVYGMAEPAPPPSTQGDLFS